MTFFGEIPCIRCERKIRIPTDNVSVRHGLTETTEFKMNCPYCKEDFFVEIKIIANKPSNEIKRLQMVSV